MKEFVIQRNDSNQRVDKFLGKAVKGLPKSLMYKYIRLKRIKVNGKRCEISTILQEGDLLSLYINDEFFSSLKDPVTSFLQAPTALQIVYEDENILLIDKPPGLVVHEDNRQLADSLINRIKHYLYKKGEYCPDSELSFAPALCNRIDRNTGGIVVAAKNAESLRIINEKIQQREIQKYYLCLTEGMIVPQSAELHYYLQKDESTNKVSVSERHLDGYKEIVTLYRVISSDGKHSLAEVELKTGRTHQIRAQMAYIGFPLVGDVKYGAKEKSKYHALYSYKVKFDFKSDAGILNYLQGRTFETKDIWFAKEIRTEKKGHSDR